MPTLTITAAGASRRVDLEKPDVVLGRYYKADVRLKDVKASREHCRIVQSEAGYLLVDAGSSNGTFLNGLAVKEHPLRSGDRIQIGLTTITFEEKLAPAPAPRRPVPPRKQAAAPRKANPLAVVVVLCAAALGGVTLYDWWTRPAVDDEALRRDADRLRSAGLADEDRLDFDGAAAKYGDARAALARSPRLSARASEAEAWVRSARARQSAYAALKKRFDELQAEAMRPEGERRAGAELASAAEGLIAEAGDAPLPWIGALRGLRDMLAKRR